MFFTFRVDKDITVSLINDKTKICILLLKNTKFSSRSGLNPKSFFFFGGGIFWSSVANKRYLPPSPPRFWTQRRACRCIIDVSQTIDVSLVSIIYRPQCREKQKTGLFNLQTMRFNKPVFCFLWHWGQQIIETSAIIFVDTSMIHVPQCCARNRLG